MSLIMHSNRTIARSAAPLRRTDRAPVTFNIRVIAGAARKAFERGARLVAHAARAVAEARLQKAIIEAELYQRRYKHSSKNDDDLPIVRRTPAESPIRNGDMPISSRPHIVARMMSLPSSVKKAWLHAPRAAVEMAKRTLPVVLAIAVFAVVLATTTMLRLAAWLPPFPH